MKKKKKKRLNEAIEEEKNSDRVPKDEETVIESLKKEVRKLKIENNRSDIATKVHYGDRVSWKDHQKWPEYRSNQRYGSRSESRSRYQRSDSQPGLWRSKSNGANYRRFRSKTPTRQDNKGPQREGEKSLKDRVDSIQTKLDTTDKKMDNTEKKLDAIMETLKAIAKDKNVTFTPMFIRDNNIELGEDEIAVSDAVSEILFTKKEQSIENMTLDTGCPPNLVSEAWLEKYLMLKRNRKYAGT